MAGALAQTVGQAAIMLVLAQVASTQIVGQYALGLAIATPLNVFADRAIRMLQATAGDNDFPLGDYLAASLPCRVVCIDGHVVSNRHLAFGRLDWRDRPSRRVGTICRGHRPDTLRSTATRSSDATNRAIPGPARSAAAARRSVVSAGSGAASISPSPPTSSPT